jgi:tetratricopeptide (TPR) repeat protein
MTHETWLESAEQHRQTAYAAFERGDFATARRFYEQALALYDQVWAQRPDQILAMRIFYALRSLGACALQLKDYAAARDAYERIFLTYQRRRALLQEEELHMNLLDAYIGLHDSDAVVAEIHQAQEFARLHDTHRQSTFLWQLADIATQIQRYDVAGGLFAQAYAVSERIAKGLEYQSKLLWAWGQFEYTHRSHDDGRALHHLAVITAVQHVDDWRFDTRQPQWRDRAFLTRYAASLDAHEDKLNTLEQTLSNFDIDDLL